MSSQSHRARTERARKILADLGVVRHGRPASVVQRALTEDWLSLRGELDRLRSRPMDKSDREREGRLVALSGKVLERLQATRRRR